MKSNKECQSLKLAPNATQIIVSLGRKAIIIIIIQKSNKAEHGINLHDLPWNKTEAHKNTRRRGQIGPVGVLGGKWKRRTRLQLDIYEILVRKSIKHVHSSNCNTATKTIHQKWQHQFYSYQQQVQQQLIYKNIGYHLTATYTISCGCNIA